MDDKTKTKKNSSNKNLTDITPLPWNMNSKIEKELNTEKGAKDLISVVEEKVKEEEKIRRIPILKDFYDKYRKALDANESIKPDLHPGYTDKLIARDNGELIYSKEMANKKRNAISKINNMVNAYNSWIKTGNWEKFEIFCNSLK